MKFYMTPGSCSTGIHILLEELDLIFEAHIVDLMRGDHLKPSFLAINPRGSVPTLVRDDGSALCDFKSIAFWLAEAYPKRRLLPEGEAARADVAHVMDHAIGTLHGEGFTRIFVTDRYAVDDAERASVEREGRALLERGFRVLENMLTRDRYVLDTYSVADAAVFYVEFWADRIGVPLPAGCQAHYLRMLERPAVRTVLAEEGYVSTLRKYA